MAGVPFKVCVPSSNVQVGVVARSYEHFRDLLQTKLGLAKDSQVYLEDGTLICDEEYFDLLEPQTKLTIIEPDMKMKVGEKRSMVAPTDSVSSLPPAKRSSLAHNEVINGNNNSAFHNNLVHCLRISSVAGSVPMRSPTHSPNRQHPPLQHLTTSPNHSLCIPPNTFVRNTQPLSHFAPGQQMQSVPQSTRHSLYQQVQPMVLDQGRFQRHRIPVTNPTYVGISHGQPAAGCQYSQQQTVPARYDLSYPHQYYQGLPQISAHPYTSLVHVPGNRQAVYCLQPEFVSHSQPQATISRPRRQTQPPPLQLIPTTDKRASRSGSEAVRNTVPSTQESLCLTNPITMGVHVIQPIEQKLGTPISGVTPISEVKQRLSVVACSDVPQSEDTDDEDKLSIIENAEGSTTPVRSGQSSPAFSFSSSKSQSRPSTLSTHSICQENTLAGSGCESPISLVEEDTTTTTTTTTSKQCDLCSPDDGYSSSSPPQSAADHELTMKLPFADFEGPPPSSMMDKKSDAEVPPTEQELVDVVTVDDKTEMSGDECLQPQEDHLESPGPLQLVVSFPVQHRDNGRILCQGVNKEEQLGISIPVRVSPSGRIVCRGSEVKPTEIIVVSDDDEEEGCVEASKEPTFRTYHSEIQWLESFKKDPLELPRPEMESHDEVSVVEQPPTPMEHHSDMEQPPAPPVELHLDVKQPPTPMEHHSDMEQPSTPPVELHLDVKQPPTPTESYSDMEQPPTPPVELHLDMEQPPTPPMESHPDIGQPPTPMEHHSDMEQPSTPPVELHLDVKQPPTPTESYSDMEQPSTPPVESHPDIGQPPTPPMESHPDIGQPPTPPMESHPDIGQPPTPPMESHPDIGQPPTPPMESHPDMEQPPTPPMESHPDMEQPPTPPMESHPDMEQPPTPPMESHPDMRQPPTPPHLDMQQPPTPPMESHPDMRQPPTPPHLDMQQPPTPPMESHPDIGQPPTPPHLDMQQPPTPPMESHPDIGQPPTPMESHPDMQQPPTSPSKSQTELFRTLIEQTPELPMDYQADLPSPPMFHLLLESPEPDENMQESRPQETVEVPNCPTPHQEPEEEPVVVEDYGCQEHVLTTLKLCTTEEIQKCVQTLIAFAEEMQKDNGVLLVDDDMVFADVEYNIGNEVTVDSLDDMEDNLVDQIRLENAVPDDEIETEVVDMDPFYTCDQQNPSGHEIPFVCSPLPSASARKALSEGIHKLIEVADHLSEEDTAAIKDFFLDGPTKAKGLQKYILQTSSKYVCLELNFDTQEWSGYIMAH